MVSITIYHLPVSVYYLPFTSKSKWNMTILCNINIVEAQQLPLQNTQESIVLFKNIKKYDFIIWNIYS